MFDRANVSRLFSINPTIKSLLQDAASPKIARNFLTVYLEELVRIVNREKAKQPPLEWAIQMSCLNTFRRIISIRSERLAKFSLIALLWKLAHEEYEELPPELSDGFFEEMIHLFKGILGKSGIYDQTPYPDYMRHEGREAAILRSGQLDEMAAKNQEYIKRYPSGLDEEIVRLRQENKKRILKYFGGSAADWEDYHWHLQHVVRNSEVLGKLIKLTDAEKQAIDRARENNLPFGITPYYVSLMDEEPDRVRDHAVRAQVIPPHDYVDAVVDHSHDPFYSFDFMLERDTSPIDLITRRYPHIAILKPYNTCSQICVYCQRNWEISDVLYKEALATKSKLDQAIHWIREHEALTEILVTGGDPLVMTDNRIEYVLSRLAEIDHVERIRLGSRTPVVLPQRLTDKLADIIAKYHQPGRREIALVTHFEHPYEITPEAMEAVQKFRRRGLSVYNQAVFTVENSRKFELVALRRLLRLIGVDPYYTFNTKGKEETKSYRVPMARLQQELKEEARLMPGMVRTDEAVYNVPRLGKNYLRAEQHHSLLTVLPNGRRVYEFHPWEKNLSLADTFVDIDVSIYDYLKEMERRGEEVDDYKTIWYYF